MWHVSCHPRSRDDVLPVWKQQMRLFAKLLLSAVLLRSSSAAAGRFTSLRGLPDRKHCYYLHLASSHLLLEKKKVCSQTEGKQKFACPIHLPVSLDGERYRARSLPWKARWTRAGRLVSRLKEVISGHALQERKGPSARQASSFCFSFFLVITGVCG